MLEPAYCLNEGSDSPKLTHLSLAEVTAPQQGDYKSSNQWKDTEGSFNLILRYVISCLFFFFTSAMPKFSQFFSPEKKKSMEVALHWLFYQPKSDEEIGPLLRHNTRDREMPFGSYWCDPLANLHRTENPFVKAAREDLWSEPT